MKPTPSCSPIALAECVPPARIVDGDVVRAPRGAQPAHAMREPRRRQAHLRVLEALADLAEDVRRRHAHVLEPHDTVAAREARVETAHRPLDHDAGRIHVGQEHRGAGVVGVGHDDRERRALGAGDEPLAAVDDVVVAVARRGGRRASTGRSRRPAAARSCRSTSGSRRAASGRSQRSFCAGVATASSRCMLPSSGANTLSAIGPSGE